MPVPGIDGATIGATVVGATVDATAIGATVDALVFGAAVDATADNAIVDDTFYKNESNKPTMISTSDNDHAKS